MKFNSEKFIPKYFVNETEVLIEDIYVHSNVNIAFKSYASYINYL
ncbi:hypothetical protein [Clostridium massiliamazoniense]|nr:hypothetical protein [Clostridium massiliamazoniense]